MKTATLLFFLVLAAAAPATARVLPDANALDLVPSLRWSPASAEAPSLAGGGADQGPGPCLVGTGVIMILGGIAVLVFGIVNFVVSVTDDSDQFLSGFLLMLGGDLVGTLLIVFGAVLASGDPALARQCLGCFGMASRERARPLDRAPEKAPRAPAVPLLAFRF